MPTQADREADARDRALIAGFVWADEDHPPIDCDSPAALRCALAWALSERDQCHREIRLTHCDDADAQREMIADLTYDRDALNGLVITINRVLTRWYERDRAALVAWRAWEERER